MQKIKIFSLIFLSLLFFQTAKAGNPQKELKDYLNNEVQKVKQTDDAVQKRMMLNNLFIKLDKAINIAKETHVLSDEDASGMQKLQKIIKDGKAELNGENGFVKVEDQNLNRFADYTVQQMEQSTIVLSISLVALILIIIAAILIF